MKFRVHSEMSYQVLQPSTFIFNIHALKSASQTVLEESLLVEPYIRWQEFSTSHHAGRLVRLEAPGDAVFKVSYQAIADTCFRELDHTGELPATPVMELDESVIPYLYPSRYCQSDKLLRLAYNKFGRIGNVCRQVSAITDWIYNNVEYLSGSTNSQTSAFDTITERAGVCRDFAHLGIALCRALSIPARYFTGYAYKLKPEDFHACFEAYIGGHWVLFDPTRLVPLNGLVKIATGRDAADAAVASIFGNAVCQSISVGCTVTDEAFEPFKGDKDGLRSLTYE